MKIIAPTLITPLQSKTALGQQLEKLHEQEFIAAQTLVGTNENGKFQTTHSLINTQTGALLTSNTLIVEEQEPRSLSFLLHDGAEHGKALPGKTMVDENLVGGQNSALRKVPEERKHNENWYEKIVSIFQGSPVVGSSIPEEVEYEKRWLEKIIPLFKEFSAGSFSKDAAAVAFEPLFTSDFYKYPFVQKQVGQTMFKQTPVSSAARETILNARESMILALHSSGHTLTLPVQRIQGCEIPLYPQVHANPEAIGDFYGICHLPKTIAPQVKAANEALQYNTPPTTYIGKIISGLAHALRGIKPEHNKYGSVWDLWA